MLVCLNAGIEELRGMNFGALVGSAGILARTCVHTPIVSTGQPFLRLRYFVVSGWIHFIEELALSGLRVKLILWM